MMNKTSELFNGVYKDLWRQIIPPGLTPVELEFIQSHCHLNTSSKILDLMCGFGRHSIPLASEGIKVVAVDSCKDYIQEIVTVAADKYLPIDAICDDITKFSRDELFDAAICMGNSISSFDKPSLTKIFSNTRKSLKSGSFFVINVWTIAEIIYFNFKEKEWYQIGDFKYLLDNKFELNPSRFETKHTVVSTSQTVDEMFDVDFIYSIQELSELLRVCGFEIDNCYSTPKNKRFKLGDKYLYIVAQAI